MKTIDAMTKKEYVEYLISVFETNKIINNYYDNHLKFISTFKTIKQ